MPVRSARPGRRAPPRLAEPRLDAGTPGPFGDQCRPRRLGPVLDPSPVSPEGSPPAIGIVAVVGKIAKEAPSAGDLRLRRRRDYVLPSLTRRRSKMGITDDSDAMGPQLISGAKLCYTTSGELHSEGGDHEFRSRCFVSGALLPAWTVCFGVSGQQRHSILDHHRCRLGNDDLAPVGGLLNGAGVRSAGLDRSAHRPPTPWRTAELGRRPRAKTRPRDLARGRPARWVQHDTGADLDRFASRHPFQGGRPLGPPPAADPGDEASEPVAGSPFAERSKTAWMMQRMRVKQPQGG